MQQSGTHFSNQQVKQLCFRRQTLQFAMYVDNRAKCCDSSRDIHIVLYAKDISLVSHTAIYVSFKICCISVNVLLTLYLIE